MHQKKLDTPIIELYLSLAQPPTLHLCIFVPRPQQVWGGRSSVWRIAQHCTGDIHLAFVEHRDRSWSGIISYQRERAPLCSQKAKPTGIAARGCFHILFLNRALAHHWIFIEFQILNLKTSDLCHFLDTSRNHDHQSLNKNSMSWNYNCNIWNYNWSFNMLSTCNTLSLDLGDSMVSTKGGLEYSIHTQRGLQGSPRVDGSSSASASSQCQPRDKLLPAVIITIHAYHHDQQ